MRALYRLMLHCQLSVHLIQSECSYDNRKQLRIQAIEEQDIGKCFEVVSSSICGAENHPDFRKTQHAFWLQPRTRALAFLAEFSTREIGELMTVNWFLENTFGTSHNSIGKHQIWAGLLCM